MNGNFTLPPQKRIYEIKSIVHGAVERTHRTERVSIEMCRRSLFLRSLETVPTTLFLPRLSTEEVSCFEEKPLRFFKNMSSRQE